MVTVVLIYSNNCAIWILLTTNNCEGLFGSFTPSVKAKVKVVAASYCGTGTGGTTSGGSSFVGLLPLKEKLPGLRW